ncbi:MAG: efflux RND transporter periplasmic adaptor subunit [Desulfobacterium sp.]|nr:efflux RND transporter periplasmic adaptor subunit [Desulfobacterium sp.]MBU3948797.1 efflux RND transporter periplasmic adaptor subunit [Pseudomonadota bacterium]MBU4009713.1 efflux RND transporter periplasmic adaptor subunit [Pseudomonadota bacterium]MBU4035440.1 efflux RND transporter periplasmic adaptor subunit [Pseudomonadota bacterium]
MSDEDISRLSIKKDARIAGTGRKKRYYIFIIAVLIIFAIIILYKNGLLTPALPVRGQKIMNIYPSQTYTLLNASGYVVAQRKAAISSKITGRLVFLGVEEGSRVKKGEVVARLENDDVMAAKNRAIANVNTAKALLEQAMAEYDDATLYYNRISELAESKTVSETEFDVAMARFKRTKAAVSGQKAAIKASESALKEAEVMLDYTNLRAPFDAVVLTKNADLGDIVTPLGSAANAKAAVVDIADMESLQVEVDVSESNINSVRKGQPCEIRLDALQEERFAGKVHMVVPTADRTKASIMVKVAFIGKDPRVLPEMSAKVAFLSREVMSGEQNAVMAIPANSIIENKDNPFVFLVTNGRAVEKKIKTGKKLGNMVEISEGLEIGEFIITEPLDKIRAGIKVKVLEE